MTALPASPFWTFSLAFYARPGAAPACLLLQDRYGADVNLILLALWLGRRGQRLDAAMGQHLQRLGRRWQRPLIAPLRRARRRLKHRLPGLPWPAAAGEVRGRLMAVELALEQMEQLLLEAALGPLAEGPADEAAARHNLARLGLTRAAAGAEMELLLRTAFSAPEPGG